MCSKKAHFGATFSRGNVVSCTWTWHSHELWGAEVLYKWHVCVRVHLLLSLSLLCIKSASFPVLSNFCVSFVPPSTFLDANSSTHTYFSFSQSSYGTHTQTHTYTHYQHHSNTIAKVIIIINGTTKNRHLKLKKRVFRETLNDSVESLSLRRGIPEGGGDMPEGWLAVSLCLRIPGPGNVKERSRHWSERPRRGVDIKEAREAERAISMNWLVCGK